MNNQPIPALLLSLLVLLVPTVGTAQEARSASRALDLSLPRDAALSGYRSPARPANRAQLPDLGGQAKGFGSGGGVGRGGGNRADLPYGAGYEARQAGRGGGYGAGRGMGKGRGR